MAGQTVYVFSLVTSLQRSGCRAKFSLAGVKLFLVCWHQEVEALEELMKTVDGSKYSVHASSILESHDMLEPVAVSSSAAASSKVSFALHQSVGTIFSCTFVMC